MSALYYTIVDSVWGNHMILYGTMWLPVTCLLKIISLKLLLLFNLCDFNRTSEGDNLLFSDLFYPVSLYSCSGPFERPVVEGKLWSRPFSASLISQNLIRQLQIFFFLLYSSGLLLTQQKKYASHRDPTSCICSRAFCSSKMRAKISAMNHNAVKGEVY